MDEDPEPVSGILRLIRACLGLVGGLLFGFGSGMMLSHLLLTLLTGGIRQDGWGAAAPWLVICLFGGLIGSIAGVVTAISLLQSQFYKPYQWIDLLAIIIGCLIALLITYLVFRAYFPMARLVPMSAFVPTGGFLARWSLRTFYLNRRSA